MTVSVIVPYRSDNGGHRDRAFTWVAERWHRGCPEFEVMLGTDDGGTEPGQFNRSLALNRAADAASGDVLVIADADTTCEPSWALAAVERVRGGAPWVLATHYAKMSEQETERILAGRVDVELTTAGAEWVGTNSQSGIVVIERRAFEAVNGFDESFTHWGYEDVAFALALATLVAPAERLPGQVSHLWHPVHPEAHEHANYYPQLRLFEYYLAASASAERMRALVHDHTVMVP